MIPIIDALPIIADLNEWGWKDFKIDTVCGFCGGYVAQIKCGNIKEMGHRRAVSLYNFWESEALARGVAIPPYNSPLQTQEPVLTPS